MSTFWFIKKVSPKLMVVQLMLRSQEYDQKTSDALIESIKQGEESFTNQKVAEDGLVKEMQEMLNKVAKEKDFEQCTIKYKNMFGV